MARDAPRIPGRVEWFVNSVGGAIITGNSFRNGTLQYIRARGTYDNAQFDWAAFWSRNTFDHATVALESHGTFPVRTYAYASGYYSFNNVRRIGAMIQPEVENTTSGDVVLAKGGAFVEQVNISHSLTLRGAGAATTTIIAPSDLPIAEEPTSNIVTIYGSATVNVDISGFTIRGPSATSCGSIRTGIFVRDGAKGTIHDNSIVDIRDTFDNGHLSGCQNGIGIAVGRQAWGTTGLAVITHNEISGFQKGGIVVDNAGTAATIDGNTVSGIGATTFIAQNGIQISRGATATVTGNTISGINYAGPWDACGLLLYDAGGVAQNSNMFRNNNKNLCNAGRGGGKATAAP